MSVEGHKTLNLYGPEETELWEQVEETVRREHDADEVREGKIVAQAFAKPLDVEGPLNEEKSQ